MNIFFLNINNNSNLFSSKNNNYFYNSSNKKNSSAFFKVIFKEFQKACKLKSNQFPIHNLLISNQIKTA